MDIVTVFHRTRPPLTGRAVTQAAEKFLIGLKIRRASLSVVFLEGRAMRRLNRRCLAHDHVTDVITFDLGSSAGSIEGEIFICPAEARRNARACGESYDREILRYLAHGILHLKGKEDATSRQRALMHRAEDALLRLVD